MDDFGTGYSSLSYLWRFPFDKIKIDRSFMQVSTAPSRDAETVVKTIIALGRELDMRVTVEGVETAEQAAFLDRANADQVQGFFFGRPLPAADIAATILTDFKSAESCPCPPPPPSCSAFSARMCPGRSTQTSLRSLRKLDCAAQTLVCAGALLTRDRYEFRSSQVGSSGFARPDIAPRAPKRWFPQELDPTYRLRPK